MQRFALAFLLLVLAGCMEGKKENPLPSAFASKTATRLENPIEQPSLYERLGGEKAIIKVVDDFVANVVVDEKIKEVHKKHFREGDVAGLKKKLIEQIGQATGGPQKYTGKSMKEAHKGLEITNADFDALVNDLKKALEDNKAKKADRDEILQMLAGMRKDVVEKED